MASVPFKVAFRTDASVQIGTGHVMRCLALADALVARGTECLFVCRPHSGNLLELIAGRGHKVAALPAPAALPPSSGAATHAHWLGAAPDTDAADTRAVLDGTVVDWLVVDHYALDSRWERALRPYCKRLMAIDDLADRHHDCDLLLDQNLGRTEAHYSALLPKGTATFIGPHYALLRPEFGQLRATSLARRNEPQLQRLLITLGGVDKDNVTSQVLLALKTCPLPAGLEIAVVMGPHAPWLQQVQTSASHMPRPTQVLSGVANMAQLMAGSDLAIGAAGSTSWERCCLGVPTVQLVLADNQEGAAAALSALSAVESITSVAALAVRLPEVFRRLNATLLKSLSERSALLCGGHGTAIVSDALLQPAVT